MRKSIAVLFLSGLFSVPSFAQDYYVCNNGANTNKGLSPSEPWATFDYAISKFNGLNAGDSILFCRGGQFTSSYLRIFNQKFTAELPGTIGDYLPAGASPEAPRPALAGGAAGALNFQDGGNADADRGYVVRNFILQGVGSGRGVFMYNDVNDVLIDNVRIDGFAVGIHLAGTGALYPGADGNNDRITLINSEIVNNIGSGWLGGGDNITIKNNRFDNNGSGDPLHDHNFYGSNLRDSVIDGNVLTKSSQIDGRCGGVSLVIHGIVDNLRITNNTVSEEIGAARPVCWGISVDPGYASEESFNNVVISGNTVSNVGNVSIGCASCTHAWIIDNTITHAQDFGATAISVPVRPEDAVKSAKVLVGGNDITLIDQNRRGKNAVVAPATDEFYQIGNAVH
jgi:hypothetical protein